MHWAAAYVGMAWDGQDQHCWNFCRLVWAEHFGLAVPEIPFDAHDARATRRAFEGEPERRLWQDVTTPEEGDAVLMAMGRLPCHIGIWLATGAVLHAIRGGSIVTPVPRLRDLGYHVVGTYRRLA